MPGRRRVTVALAAVTLALSGCGSVVDALAGRDSGSEVAKVVVLVPQQGPHAAAGDGVHAAVTLALADVDAGDWDLVIEELDDGTSADNPLVAAGDVAAEIAGDRDVIAVIGGLTPDAVRGAQRPLDENGIAFVSPADDDPANTRGADPSAPQRPYDSYFRTAMPDADPLAAAARYAVSGVGAATVVVVHDGPPQEAARLARHVTALGADAQLSRLADLEATLSNVESDDSPVAVYVVDDRLAAEVTSMAARARVSAVVIGGEELTSAAIATDDAMVAIVPGSSAARPAANVPGVEAAGANGAAAYDAGRAVAQMLERCLPPAEGSARDARHGCLSELDTVSVTGATGHVSFDRYGDRPGTWPTVLVHDEDGWTDVAQR